MSGPSSPPMNRAPTGWSGSTTRTRHRISRCEIPRQFQSRLLGEKWTEARDRKYRPSKKQKPDAIVAGANKRLASRFLQLRLVTALPDNTSCGPEHKMLVVPVQQPDP